MMKSSTAAATTSSTTSSSTTTTKTSPSCSLLSQFPLSCQLSQQIVLELQSFCYAHAVQQSRPMVVVSSGGTAADLEVRTVRSLENFSTGLRGAISVEEFLAHGYAVVFLQRTGSASPYARIVSQVLNEYTTSTSNSFAGNLNQVNHGLHTTALEALFQDEASKQRKKAGMNNNAATASAGATGTTSTTNQDPWSMDSETSATATATDSNINNPSTSHDSSFGLLQLQDRLCHDERLQRAWRDYNKTVVSERRLFTIPFRTVEEYLVRLEQISNVLQPSARSLCLFYLAAAVSDYYIPNKVEHKIQSTSLQHNGDHDGGDDSNLKNYSNALALTLTFQSVPKVMGWLRQRWAPDAFVVSFKLETDMAILRRKAEGAVMNYNVHMVIGNILETRHDKVYVLYNDKQDEGEQNHVNDKKTKNNSKNTTVSVQDWCMKEISKSSSSYHSRSSSSNQTTTSNNNKDAGPPLEEDLIEFVVQQHFYYISKHYHPTSSSSFATMVHDRLVIERKEYQRQLFWQSLQDKVMQWGGTLIGMGITYMVSMAIQARIHQSNNLPLRQGAFSR